MRLGAPGEERPAVLAADGTVLDASGVLRDVDAAALAAGGLAALREAVDAGTLPVLDPAEVARLRVGAPVARPGKVVCVGINYAEHAAETGAEAPPEPVLFMKDPWTVVGAYDEVLVPRRSSKTDYEVELAVVVGETMRYLGSPAEGLGRVAGYAVSHDVSEREFQLERGGTWDKGKSCETFNPLGPWLVTPDEVPDVQDLGVRLWVDGEVRQDGSTRQMIFGVGALLHYLSQFMVLHPGDVINTGTPAGVALGMPDPKPYLRPGMVVEVEIDGLGRQRSVMGQA